MRRRHGSVSTTAATAVEMSDEEVAELVASPPARPRPPGRGARRRRRRRPPALHLDRGEHAVERRLQVAHALDGERGERVEHDVGRQAAPALGEHPAQDGAARLAVGRRRSPRMRPAARRRGEAGVERGRSPWGARSEATTTCAPAARGRPRAASSSSCVRALPPTLLQVVEEQEPARRPRTARSSSTVPAAMARAQAVDERLQALVVDLQLAARSRAPGCRWRSAGASCPARWGRRSPAGCSCARAPRRRAARPPPPGGCRGPRRSASKIRRGSSAWLIAQPTGSPARWKRRARLREHQLADARAASRRRPRPAWRWRRRQRRPR